MLAINTLAVSRVTYSLKFHQLESFWIKKLDTKTVWGRFQRCNNISYSAGVTFKKDWEAKDGECKKCGPDGAGGAIIIEKKCEAEEQYSCNGVKTPTKTTNEPSACVTYCSAGMTRAYFIFGVWRMGGNAKLLGIMGGKELIMKKIQ